MLGARFVQGDVDTSKPITWRLPSQLEDEAINRSVHVVGTMDAEPITGVLEDGGEVVIADRSRDTSLFAAIPLALRLVPDSMSTTTRSDYFIVES